MCLNIYQDTRELAPVRVIIYGKGGFTTARRIVCCLSIIVSILIFSAFAYAQPFPIFGPNKYLRTTGKPNTYSDTFQACNLGAAYNLVAENGEGGKDRLSSASVTLNGQEIIKEKELNQQVDKIEKTVTLQTENTLNVKLASGPGGFIKLSIQCVSGCLGIEITSPAHGATINKSRVLIQGILSHLSGETGVIVNSIPGQTQGTNFAAMVPLQQGQNSITATATDACGYKVQDTITINTETLQEPIRLTAIPSSGTPTLNVTFEAEPSIQNPVSNYAWDLNGDGTPEQTGPTLSKLTTQYQNSGLYFPKVTITDTEGNTYEETTMINVLSKVEMDALLKGKWEGMKEALGQGKVEKALLYFTQGSKERYRGIFTAISNQLPDIVRNMQEIRLIYMKDGVAKYRIRRIENAGEVTYYIYFEVDENGLWRLRQF